MANEPREQLSESEQKQRAYYDQIASQYDEHYGSREGLAYRARQFERLMGDYDLEGLKALDAMCGGGQNSTYFVSRGCHVTGIDISQGQTEFYRKRFPGSEVVCGSALSMPFEDESFDLVFTDSLHHLPPRVNEGMQEIARVLRPGGLFLAWEPSARSVFDYARKLWYRLDPEYFEDNEEAIDIDRLAADNKALFDLRDCIYGGNVAYASVALSMAMRIPVRVAESYAKGAQWLEDKLTPLQGRRTALWALVLFEKR